MESIMQFIYLWEARFYEESMSEFLSFLEIKELSTGIEMNVMVKAKIMRLMMLLRIWILLEHLYMLHYCYTWSVSVEPQAQTEQHKSKKDIDVSGAAKFQCRDCERVFNSQPVLWYHTKSKNEGLKYGCNHCDYQATRVIWQLIFKPNMKV